MKIYITNQKKAVVAAVISDKADVRAKNTKGQYLMIKRVIYQEDA